LRGQQVPWPRWDREGRRVPRGRPLLEVPQVLGAQWRLRDRWARPGLRVLNWSCRCPSKQQGAMLQSEQDTSEKRAVEMPCSVFRGMDENEWSVNLSGIHAVVSSEPMRKSRKRRDAHERHCTGPQTHLARRP